MAAGWCYLATQEGVECAEAPGVEGGWDLDGRKRRESVLGVWGPSVGCSCGLALPRLVQDQDRRMECKVSGEAGRVRRRACSFYGKAGELQQEGNEKNRRQPCMHGCDWSPERNVRGRDGVALNREASKGAFEQDEGGGGRTRRGEGLPTDTQRALCPTTGYSLPWVGKTDSYLRDLAF